MQFQELQNTFLGLIFGKFMSFSVKASKKFWLYVSKGETKNVLTLFCILKHLKNLEYDVENWRHCLNFRSVRKKTWKSSVKIWTHRILSSNIFYWYSFSWCKSTIAAEAACVEILHHWQSLLYICSALVNYV